MAGSAGSGGSGNGGSDTGGSGNGGSDTGGSGNGGSDTGGATGSGGAGGSGAMSIGLDVRHGFYNSSTGETTSFALDRYSQFRSAITSEGYTLVPLTSFTSAALDGLSAVIVSLPYAASSQGFTSTEIAALVTFVDDGGGMLAHGDGGSGGMVDNLNELLANWGVQFSSTPTGGDGVLVTGFVNHAVTTGVTSVGFDYYLPILSFNLLALDLTSGTPDLMAIYDDGPGGAGSVVMIGDKSQWSNPDESSDYDIEDGDTRRLLSNIVMAITSG